MQMVAVIFRKSLENEVLTVLRACNVQAFTDIGEVWGAGESGQVFNSFARPGFNSIVLAALDEPDAERVVMALRVFREDAVRQQRGAPVPLHVFLLPCQQAV